MWRDVLIVLLVVVACGLLFLAASFVQQIIRTAVQSIRNRDWLGGGSFPRISKATDGRQSKLHITTANHTRSTDEIDGNTQIVTKPKDQ